MLARPLRPVAAALALLFALAPRALAAADSTEETETSHLRERLMEREDEKRVEEPWTRSLFGNPLSASGQYEIVLEATDPVVPGQPPVGDDRLLLEQELEGEIFYTLGEPLSFFAQARLRWDRDLLPETPHGADDWYVERGEMWIFAHDLFGSDVDLDLGRLNFEDDRRWWWDSELDAVRLAWEGGPADAFGASLALGWELGPDRSDRHRLAADEEDLLRVLAELSWEVAANHGVELFALLEDDRSGHAPVGASVRASRADETDARLFWLGPRALGGFVSESAWTLGYWLDGGLVRGSELIALHGDPEAGLRPVEFVARRDVSGWALDLGLVGIAPTPLEPRVTLAYAIGSGDDRRGSRDHAYRQSGLHANETGFGGVRRFPHYGRLLDPELSNLGVATVGAGISLFAASSLDLVYHHYRLIHRAESLRSSRLESALDGRHRSVGHGVDLVLAIEEGDRFELELSGSVFRAGSAFGPRRGEWAFGGLAALRVAF